MRSVWTPDQFPGFNLNAEVSMKRGLVLPVLLTALLPYTRSQASAELSANLAAMPSFVNFFDTQVGSGGQSSSVTITNQSQEMADSVFVRDNCFSHFYVFSSCSLRLEPYQSCMVQIQFRPIMAGTHSCSVNVSGTNTNTASVWVQGRGVE